MRSSRHIIRACLLLTLVLSGCGGSGDDAGPASPPAQRMASAQGFSEAISIAGARAGYVVTRTDTGVTVTDIAGSAVSQDYANVTSLKFADLTVNLRIADNANTIPAADLTSLIELYVAFFNRVPDADGLSYWIDQLRGGQSLVSIGNAFYSAALANSAATGYSASMSNEDFIRVIYRNVLGRDNPDQGGLDYWAGLLASGQVSRGAAVGTIITAAHGLKTDPTYGWVHNLLANKTTVAHYFAVQHGLNFSSASESITRGATIAAAVTANNASAGLAMVDALLPSAQPADLAYTVQANNALMLSGSYQGTPFRMVHSGTAGAGTWSVYTGAGTDRVRVTYTAQGGLQEVLALDSGLRITVQTVGQERAEYRWYGPDKTFLIGSVVYTLNGSWYQGTLQTEAFTGYSALTDVQDISTGVQATLAQSGTTFAVAQQLRQQLPNAFGTGTGTEPDTEPDTEDPLKNAMSDFTSPFDRITGGLEQIRQFGDKLVVKGKEVVKDAATAAVIVAFRKELAILGAGVTVAEGMVRMKDFVNAARQPTDSESTAAFEGLEAGSKYVAQSAPVTPTSTVSGACSAPSTPLADGSCTIPVRAGCKDGESFRGGVCVGGAISLEGDRCSNDGGLTYGVIRSGACYFAPAVTSVDKPATFSVGQSANIVFRGTNLSMNGITITLEGCTMAAQGGTSTAQTYSCTPASTGTKYGTVKDALTGAQVLSFSIVVPEAKPTVTSMSPATATLDTLTTFTFNGTNLPEGMEVTLADCAGMTELAGGTTDKRQFSCTPGTAGSKSGMLKDKPNGAGLGVFFVTVACAAGQTNQNGVCAVPTDRPLTCITKTYTDGSPYEKYCYYVDAKGAKIKHGPYEYYGVASQSKAYYADGLLDGPFKAYEQYGSDPLTLSATGQYKAGKESGTWMTYYTSSYNGLGKLSRITTYELAAGGYAVPVLEKVYCPHRSDIPEARRGKHAYTYRVDLVTLELTVVHEFGLYPWGVGKNCDSTP